MTITELELRVATLEKKLAHLADKIDSPATADVNAWIDQIHGTFENDAVYRKAARFGRQWRKSQGGPKKPRARKAASK